MTGKNSTIYYNEQKGWLIIIVTVITTILLLTILIMTKEQTEKTITIIVMIITLTTLIGFTKIKTTITEKEITTRFKYPFIKKKIPLKEITRAEPVKNKWWYGWGIRIIPWKKTIIYNVSGLKAVEITTRKGTKYRIGTNEPEKLARKINEEIKKAKKE